MALVIQGIARDLRCDTYVAYGQVPVEDYLDLVGQSFDKVEVQRKRQRHPAYTRLKSDVAEGALIPTITLAVDPQAVGNLIPLIEKQDLSGLAHALTSSHNVFILDGLQRTYILNDLKREGHHFKTGQTIHVEIWLEKSIQNFIYRVLILNAGQKPMSTRHQVKLIFLTVKSSLETEIEGLHILRKGQERLQPKEYQLDHIITAYLSFFLETPEISDDNLTGRGLIKQDLFNSALIKMGRRFKQFKQVLTYFSEIDRLALKVYQSSRWKVLPAIDKLMASESMLNSFFAAAGRSFAQTDSDDTIDSAADALIRSLESGLASEDPLGLDRLDEVLGGISPQKHNVGYEKRMKMTRGFERFFLNKGQITLGDCW